MSSHGNRTPTPEQEDELGLFCEETSPASEPVFQFDSPIRRRSASLVTSHDGSSLIGIHLVPAPVPAPLVLQPVQPVLASAPTSATVLLPTGQVAIPPSISDIGPTAAPEASEAIPSSASMHTEEGDITILPSQRSDEELEAVLGDYLLNANEEGDQLVRDQRFARVSEHSSIVLEDERDTDTGGQHVREGEKQLDDENQRDDHCNDTCSPEFKKASGVSERVSLAPDATGVIAANEVSTLVTGKKRRAAGSSGPSLASLPAMAAGGGSRVSGLSKSSLNSGRVSRLFAIDQLRPASSASAVGAAEDADMTCSSKRAKFEKSD